MDLERTNVEKEYNNIINSTVIQQSLSKHPSLKNALEQVFRETIGSEKYSVEIKNDSIIILKECSYPDATNGVYHGVKMASRCVINLESDSNKEYLVVKTENSNCYIYPERSENELFYYANVTAYDDKCCECGKGEYYTQRTVDKYYNPMAMIVSFIGNQGEKPNLDVKFAVRNYMKPSDFPSMYKWRYNSVSRCNDLISYRYSIDHIDMSHVNYEESYGRIDPYNYQRLSGNIHEFAVNTHASNGISTWKTLNGKVLTPKELSDMISENGVNLDEYLSNGRNR